MPVSPQDFSLWARATGNKYPSSLEEKARLAPEVHNFMRNFGKQGELGEQKEEKSSTLENIGKAALVAGGIAAGVAAARDPRVQTAVKDFGSAATQQASNVRENVQSFLSGLGTKRTADPDIMRNSGDVTPGPIAQQSGGQTISDPWQEPTVPMPQNRDLAGEATALASALEQIRSSKGQLGEPSRQQVYESAAQKYPDPGVGKDVEFKPSYAGISSGKESLATDPVSGQKYRVGGGTTLEQAKGLVVGELGGINGDVQYAAPEATTDTTNSLLSAPITPDNRVPKAETFNPNSLTGQQNIQEAADNIRDLAGEATALAESIGTGTRRQRPVRASEISPQEMAAYELVAAGGETGVPVSFERAMEMAGGAGDLSFQEQRLFSPGERVAVGEQSFAPGERQTGRMMGVRTGASGSERALGLAEQYAQADVGGLTSQGRKSAGSARLRGQEDAPDTSAVLVGATGRPLRGMSAISPESLREASGVAAAEMEANRQTTAGAIESLLKRSSSEPEYAAFTDVTTGSTPETQQRARSAMESAQKPSTNRQMNQLFASHSTGEGDSVLPTSSQFLNIKTEGGTKSMTTKALRRQYGPIADDVMVRAAQHYAANDGIELPDPGLNESGRITNYDFRNAAQQLIYGSGDQERTRQVGQAFNSALKGAGLDLATEDPYASHKLFTITQNQTRGQVALEEYSRKVGRMQSQGLLKEGRNVPSNIGTLKALQ